VSFSLTPWAAYPQLPGELSQDQTIIPLGETALVYVVLHIEALVGDVLRQVHSRAPAVWHLSGDVWRVVSIFSVGIPTAKP
jgi:hypothetical protein